MKKIIALLMMLAMLLTFAACKEKEENPADTTAAAVQTPIQLIRLSLTDEEGERSIYAYVNEEGQIYVEYVGEQKKTGILDASALAGITQQIEKADFVSMNEENVYNEGPATASFYIYYGEEDFIGGGYSGTAEDIPQAFIDGYGQVDSYFKTLMEDAQSYVPTDRIAENVDAEVKSELVKIFAAAGGESLAEKLIVEDVLWDEDFYSNTGLTSDSGIVNATRCSNMQIPTDYSFVIFTLEDETFINAVATDLKTNDDWFQLPDAPEYTSYIAYKGNLVLCVIGSGELYDQTVSAIGQCDWTVFEG